MRKVVVLLGAFLLLIVNCQAHNDNYFRKIDAINKNALFLENQCQEIQALAETLVAGGCCGGGGDTCVCQPLPLTAASLSINQSGYYCLQEDIPSSDISISTDQGVILDLNGHTVRNIYGNDNCYIKNGTVNSQISGGDNLVIEGVKVSSVHDNSDPSHIILIDVTGLTSIREVDQLIMIRCSNFSVGSFYWGVKNLIMYDSVISYIPNFNMYSTQLHKLHMYKSTLGGIASTQPFSNFEELSMYKSSVGTLSLLGAQNPIRMLIELSFLENVNIGQIHSPTYFSSGLITRSSLERLTCLNCTGITCNECIVGGPVAFTSCENMVCTNVSSQSAGECFSVNPFAPTASGGSLVLRDCFATTQGAGSTLAGYSFEGTCTAVNVLNCTAKGCPNGFLITSPSDAFSGVIKDCVVDGCTTGTSYALVNTYANIYAYGNTAISVGGLPATNYDVNAFTTFNPLATALTAIETDTVTSWRNISFELP